MYKYKNSTPLEKWILQHADPLKTLFLFEPTSVSLRNLLRNTSLLNMYLVFYMRQTHKIGLVWTFFLF